MSEPNETPIRPRLERPPTPYYPPGICDALKNRDNPRVRCEATPARPYPCGWRCDTHKP